MGKDLSRKERLRVRVTVVPSLWRNDRNCDSGIAGNPYKMSAAICKRRRNNGEFLVPRYIENERVWSNLM